MTTAAIHTPASPACPALDRLTALGLSLPPAARPLGNYESWSIVGETFMTSGQFPWISGDMRYTGRLGAEVTVEQGYDACRLATLNAVAQLHDALGGDFSRLRRIYRVEGVLNVAEGCFDHPQALNGASDILVEMFGDRGRHTRMIWTNPVMPRDAFCLVYMYAQVAPEQAR
ncbi:Atu1372/SO_1960 family protein [Novispirillum itersonii]|uniref:Atu1372/SO_1960 family protein n=1 Tax=Novispirillum itersonii TaxID=189 RepID=UPI00037CCE85|nr:Atu1372/SO_1960 family protein [Novispirillum itersonii]